jgi:hypothetical protein
MDRTAIKCASAYRPSRISSYKMLNITFLITVFHKLVINRTFRSSNSEFIFTPLCESTLYCVHYEGIMKMLRFESCQN